MSKDAYYFSHDSNARQDEKIIALRMKLGWEGYGLYWALIEKLRDATNYMCVKDYNLIAFDLRSDAAKIKTIIEDFGLFAFTNQEIGECFYSMSLIKRMTQFETAKAKLSVSGIKGNLIKNKHITKAQAANMTDDEILELNEKIKGVVGGESGAIKEATAIKEKEIKVNKIKGEDIKEIFPPETTQEILLSRQISIEQWAMKNKVSIERIKECITEFSEFKSRTFENLKWNNESDLIKNFEFWLNSNSKPKTEKNNLKNVNNGNPQRKLYRG